MGKRIPLPEGYADQPYVVILANGGWLCVATSADGPEGHASQGVFCLRSMDQGDTWTDMVRLESVGAPENSYAVAVVAPSGRVFAFYNFNTNNIREVRREDGGVFERVDSLGDYVFRYSDDDGLTWSAERYTVPVRPFACDQTNIYGGSLRMFWNVGRPCVRANGEVFIPLHKVGAMGEGFFAQSEGAFIASSNLLTERNPEKIEFQTFPEGEKGLTTPPGGGRVAEEHSLVELSDGSLYCVYRSVDGWPVCAYSRDGGRSWSAPSYKTFRINGRRMKNPRAANFVWKCSNGRFLYWFHNHGGPFIRELGGHASLVNGLSAHGDRSPYEDRNPAWICSGHEIDGPEGRLLEWSEPEILLYDDDPAVRLSYPDLIEQDGHFWVSETDKHTGRVHELSLELLENLFESAGAEPSAVAAPLDSFENAGSEEWSSPFPKLPRLLARNFSEHNAPTLDLKTGWTISLEIFGQPAAGSTLLDTRNSESAGLLLRSLPEGRFELTLSDGRTICSAISTSAALHSEGLNCLDIILDGGPKIVLFVLNGALCDGGNERQFGWFRYSPYLKECNGKAFADLHASVTRVTVHGRPLFVNEAARAHRKILSASVPHTSSSQLRVSTPDSSPTDPENQV